MVKERIEHTYLVGKSEKAAWRWNNLRALKHCVDKGAYFEVILQFVDREFRKVTEVKLIYHLVK